MCFVPAKTIKFTSNLVQNCGDGLILTLWHLEHVRCKAAPLKATRKEKEGWVKNKEEDKEEEKEQGMLAHVCNPSYFRLR